MSRDVAVIGMSCLFPGAPGLEDYWRNILAKVDAVTDPPPGSWETDIFFDPDSQETNADEHVLSNREGSSGGRGTGGGGCGCN